MDCLYCSAPDPRLSSWCDLDCLDAWRATFRARSGSGVPFRCPRCDKVVSVRSRDVATRKYCSRSCASRSRPARDQAGALNPNWKGGRALYYGPGWKATKIKVRERDKACRSCGKTPEQNGRALDVHHLEPFRFSGDNSLDNLVALCRSCHMRADDHGRRGSEVFLRRVGVKKVATKREFRRLEQKVRKVQALQQRRRLQERAFELDAAGRSLRQIARELGVSHQTVSNWLSGAVRRLVS